MSLMKDEELREVILSVFKENFPHSEGVKVMFAIASRKVVECNKKKIPNQVKAILEENNDIMCEKLVDGLPHKMKIVHAIYLIPGTTLPHQAMHKMSTMESAKLKEVGQLLSKRLIKRGYEPKHGSSSVHSEERCIVENVHIFWDVE